MLRGKEGLLGPRDNRRDGVGRRLEIGKSLITLAVSLNRKKHASKGNIVVTRLVASIERQKSSCRIIRLRSSTNPQQCLRSQHVVMLIPCPAAWAGRRSDRVSASARRIHVTIRGGALAARCVPSGAAVGL